MFILRCPRRQKAPRHDGLGIHAGIAFPRKRESRKTLKNKQNYIKIYYIIRLNIFWIPAFAGMTSKFEPCNNAATKENAAI
ncbi:hypothetical protein [Rickettsia endosymbiont of Orchestes rusci]|uniref:hypothetical protein n=1 Tax=Rickettsia endosymbiont of Orchestes rusci TaxID=3066250 RepID=UPI00313B5B4A